MILPLLIIGAGVVAVTKWIEGGDKPQPASAITRPRSRGFFDELRAALSGTERKRHRRELSNDPTRQQQSESEKQADTEIACAAGAAMFSIAGALVFPPLAMGSLPCF